MKENLLHEAAIAFANYTPGLSQHSAGKMPFMPVKSGLINNTWIVRCELKIPFLLQQINTNVFTKPEDVQHNYISISQYADFEFTGLRLQIVFIWIVTIIIGAHLNLLMMHSHQLWWKNLLRQKQLQKRLPGLLLHLMISI